MGWKRMSLLHSLASTAEAGPDLTFDWPNGLITKSNCRILVVVTTTAAMTETPVTGAAGATPPSTAAALLTLFRTVTRRLERTQLPAGGEDRAEQWRNANLAPRHVAALMQVIADEGMSVSTLAARLGVSLATASQVVTDLEGPEVIERYEDPTDRRRTLLRITESRRALADSLLATRVRPIQRALDRMRPADQRALLRGLELIAEELGNPADD
jgi:DNA-binding MarR family transcriptional regulator